MTEVWRPICAPFRDGWYEASDLGRVRSLVGQWGPRAEPHEMPQRLSGHAGRKRLTVAMRRCDGRRQQVYAHLAVALAFLGPRPDGMEVNHLNGDKHDNRACNLEYVSRRDNMRHAVALGLRVRGERVNTAKINAAAVLSIRTERAAGATVPALMAKYALSKGGISKIIYRQNWRHLPDIQGASIAASLPPQEAIKIRRSGR